MANENRISAVLTAQDITDIINAGNIIKTKMPFLLNLTPDERKKKRKTGNKREGYVIAVYNAVLQFPQAIPATFSVAEWTKDEELNDAAKGVFSFIRAISESVDDTLLQIGSERIKQADACYGYLKEAAKGNEALSAIVNDIAKNFLGQGRAKGFVELTVPAGGSAEVKNVVPQTQFANMGNTVLKMTAGKTETLVRPGDVAAVPERITTIKADNQSTTEEGKFSVKTK